MVLSKYAYVLYFWLRGLLPTRQIVLNICKQKLCVSSPMLFFILVHLIEMQFYINIGRAKLVLPAALPKILVQSWSKAVVKVE